MSHRALWAWALLVACQPSVPTDHPESGQGPGGATEAGGAEIDTTVTSAGSLPPREALARFEQDLGPPQLSHDGSLLALSNRFVRADTPPSSHHDLRRNHVLAIVQVAHDKTVSQVDFPSPSDGRAVREALADAQALLDEHQWEPLQPLTMEPDEAWPLRTRGVAKTLPQRGRGEDLLVQFHEPKLIVTGPAGRPIHEVELPDWSKPPGGIGSDPCTIYADLVQAWVSRQHRVLVVEVAYSADPQSCRFAPALHVLPLPAPSSEAKSEADGGAP
ncbi:MAG: hypothetical protein JRI68_04320 [Deltaproteobacteria bacterium]|nr:hypothetical protein [Deltaproteobacteria bacterium]